MYCPLQLLLLTNSNIESRLDEPRAAVKKCLSHQALRMVCRFVRIHWVIGQLHGLAQDGGAKPWV